MSHVRIVLLLWCGVSCVGLGQGATEKPADDPTAQARRKNLEAYATLYGPQRERLMSAAQGGWIAIVEGAVHPVDADGKITPTSTWQEVDARADKLHPAAAHRFVFRVGEDGDAEHFYTMAEWEHGIGSGLVDAVSKATRSTWWCAGSDVGLRRKDGSGDDVISCQGPDDRPYVNFIIRAPRGDEHVSRVMGFASAFGGPAVVSEETAQELHLERWEIPGTMLLNKHAKCRRARARFGLRYPKIEVSVDLVIWAKRRK
jgi:hypothetical protein